MFRRCTRFSLILPSRGSAKNSHETAGILAVTSSLGSEQAEVSAEKDAHPLQNPAKRGSRGAGWGVNPGPRRAGLYQALDPSALKRYAERSGGRINSGGIAHPPHPLGQAHP